MDIQSVGAALNALDGEYIELLRTGDFGCWGIPRITTAARRAVGQWPTAETIIERSAAGMTQAAERESDPSRSAGSWLSRASSVAPRRPSP